MKHDAERGRYKVEPGHTYGKPHHNAIAQALVDNFPSCEIFMSHPYDYGHSVTFVVENDGVPIITVGIQVVRHDLDGV